MPTRPTTPTSRVTLALALALAATFGCDADDPLAERGAPSPLRFVPGSDSVTTTDLDTATELAEQADAVFVGEVVELSYQRSQPDADGTELPFTVVTWQVEDGIKGVRSSSRYSARFLGGPLGDETLWVSEIPTFEVGDRDLVFVAGNGEAGCPLVGGAEGRVQLEPGEHGDGLSRVAPGPAWAGKIAAGIRAAGLGGGTADAPDLAAPFVFAMPRKATREELEEVAAIHAARMAELADREAAPAREPDAEALALAANGGNPVLSR